ncbi:MAG TPA: hypothetical protein PLK57_08055 [Clostridiales bacterium]|nr:hypothetical protein [Clostridiales bacterium]HXK84172.1 hypothetical protein [Clostridiales bacterium]
MRAALFSIGAQNTGEFKNLKEHIDSVFSAVDQKAALSDYEGLKNAVQAVSAALKECNILVFFLPLKDYFRNKILLFKLFRLEGNVSEDALRKLEALKVYESLSEAEKKASSVFPPNASVIEPVKNEFIAFSVASGKQEIAVIPFADGLTQGLLESYLVSKGLIEAKREEIREIPEDKSQETAPAEETSKAAEEATPAETEREIKFPKLEKYLSENDIKVGVASTPSSIFIKSAGENLNGFDTAFKFIPYIRERSTYDLREYAVNLASLASEMAEAPFGISITNIHTIGEGEDAERFVFIAAAGEKYAKAAKLYALPGEGAEEFLSSAADEALKLLESMIAEYLGDMDYPREAYETPPRPVQFISGAKSIAVIALIAISLIASFLAGFFMLREKNPDEQIIVSNGIDSYETAEDFV